MITDHAAAHDPYSIGRHVVTYGGSTRLGFTWKCSCGASNGEHSWDDRFDRTWEAHAHLRLYLAWPRSCMGCCYDLNKARKKWNKANPAIVEQWGQQNARGEVVR